MGRIVEHSPVPFMLSYIRHQHCRIVAFSRCLIIKCRVAPFKVVSVDIFSDCNSGFLDVAVLCQICFFIFEASEPALDHDIICPSAFSIHALPDPISPDKIYILLTGKLAALIGIQNLRFCYFEGFFQGCDDHSCIKCVIYLPADNTTAVPVDYGSQIQKSAFPRNICNIQ